MVPQTIIVSLIVFLTFMPGSELCERHDQKKRGTEDVCYGGGQIRVYIMNVSGQGRVNIFQGYGSEPRTDKPISSKPNLENKEFKEDKSSRKDELSKEFVSHLPKAMKQKFKVSKSHAIEAL
jgi:hypothetical protein